MKTINMIEFQYRLLREEMNSTWRGIFHTGICCEREWDGLGEQLLQVFLVLVFRRHLCNAGNALSPPHWVSSFLSRSPAWEQPTWACPVLFKMLFIFFVQMTWLLLQRWSFFWCCRSACESQAVKTSLPGHSPFFGGWRMSSVPPVCLSVSRGCYGESGEIQSWMLIICTVFPLRHSSILTIPYAFPNCCPSCLKTPGVQHTMCKARIQLTTKLGLGRPGKCYPVIRSCNIAGCNSCCRYVWVSCETWSRTDTR